MQKKILSGMKGGLAVFSSLLLSLCLISTAAAKKPSNPNNPNNLPNGRPFQILQGEINTLTGDITTLQSQIAALQNQIGQVNGQVVAIPNGGGGEATLAITPPTSLSILEGGKDVRFEITFVPDTAAPPATGDSYIMSALTSSENGSLSFIGVNSTGAPNAGNAATFTTPATIATITNIGSLAATSDTSYEISQAATAPSGTYYVKIIY